MKDQEQVNAFINILIAGDIYIYIYVSHMIQSDTVISIYVSTFMIHLLSSCDPPQLTDTITVNCKLRGTQSPF